MPEDDIIIENLEPVADTPENEADKKEKPKRKLQADNLIKRDVAFLQKKLAELEIAVSEVQEGIQKIDVSGIEELKQKVEDIEDLTMVENAGVIELKNFLEGIQSEISKSHELEEKVANLEQIIASPPDLLEVESRIRDAVKAETANVKEMAASVQTVKDEFQNKLNEVSTAVSELSGGLLKLNVSVNDLEKKTEEVNVSKLKEEVKNYVLPIIPGLPNFDAITKSLEDSIQVVKQDVKNYKLELEGINLELEERLNNKLQNIVSKELEEVSNLSANIENTGSYVQGLGREVADIVKELDEINPIVSRLDKINVERLKTEIRDEILPLIPEAPDMSVIKRGLEDSVEQIKFDVEKSKKDFERLKQDIEEKLKVPLHAKLLKELEEVTNESLITNSKFDAIDSFTKELAKEVSDIRPLINRLDSKVESFEGLGDVEKAIDERLHEFRDILSTAEKIKESNQPLKEIDQLLSRFRDVERRLSEIRNFIDDFDRSKDDILSLKWKTDYKKLVDETNRKFDNLKREIESRISEKGIEKLENTNKKISEVEELAMSLNKKFENNEKLVKLLESDLSVIQGNLMVVENRTSESSAESIKQLSDRVNSLDIDIGDINQLTSRLNELETKVSESSTGMMGELVNRLVFLESRLATLEGILATSRSYPIVIE